MLKIYYGFDIMVKGDILPKDISRTHFVNEISTKNIGKEIITAGWFERTRLMGKLIFLIMLFLNH